MSIRRFALVADVSSADPAAIEPPLRRLVGGEITAALHVDARDLVEELQLPVT